MGLLSFLVFALLVLCIAAVFIWIAGKVAPGHPVMIDNIAWVLAVVIILFQLWGALGGHLKDFYGWFGVPYPTLSLVIVIVLCGGVGGAGWKFLGYLHSKDHLKELPLAAPLPNAPKLPKEPPVSDDRHDVRIPVVFGH